MIAKKLPLLLGSILLSCSAIRACAGDASGLNSGLDTLYQTSSAESRSISPENFTGEPGQAGMATNGTGKHASSELGLGWKMSPCIHIKSGTTTTLADIKGPACISQMWMTLGGNRNHAIIRIYWDGETNASVECPVSEFFACALTNACQISSLAVCVNPGSGLNSYWPMPFRKSARITMENLDEKNLTLYYQINYSVAPVPRSAGYFHAQFRHEYPLKESGLYTILDGVKGEGQYVGTYMALEVHDPGWWGEGEIKFYLDGDQKYPSICGTGTEDYFCGSYNFENRETHKYQTYSTPYSGLAQVLPADKIYQSGQQFGLYRWHITDPIRFKKNLKVTIQALGWKKGGLYKQLDCEMFSVAYWYQKGPQQKFPEFPPRDQLDWH